MAPSVSAETMTAINALPEAAKTEVLEKLKKFGISSTEPAASSDAVGEEDDLFAVMAKVEAKPDLMAQLAAMSNDSAKIVATGQQASKDLEKKVVRQRRKSRDLEQEVFGMHIEDVAQLRKVFKDIDTDGSGAIDNTELREALQKAGKTPTDPQIKLVIDTYGVEGVISFDGFQKMIANWDTVIGNISSDSAPATA